MTVELMNKKVLVTGGTGFLGQHLVEELRRKGCKNIITPRSYKYDLTFADDTQEMLLDLNSDVVIHLAASVGGIGLNQKEPGRLFYENLMMGVNLIEECRYTVIEKLVLIGTICSYPKFCPAPFKEEDLWNGYPEETNAPYGIAKKALLVMAQAYKQQYGLNSIYLMPVNLYGPGDNFKEDSSHVIPALIKKFIDAKEKGMGEVEVWGTGKATREFLYVEDAARAIVMATESYDGPGPINIGSGVEIPIKDLVSLVQQFTGYFGKITWDTSKPDGQPRRLLDVSKAHKEFGFQASVSLEEGLKKTVDWYGENRI